MRHQAQTDLMFYSPQYFTQKRNKIYYMLQKVEIFQAFYKNFFSSLHHFFLLLFSSFSLIIITTFFFLNCIVWLKLI